MRIYSALAGAPGSRLVTNPLKAREGAVCGIPRRHSSVPQKPRIGQLHYVRAQEPRIHRQFLRMVGVSVNGYGRVLSAGERVTHLEVVLTARHLANVSPRGSSDRKSTRLNSSH